MLFPLCAAAVLVADACTGVSPTDPSVKVCHDDTLAVGTVRRSNGEVEQFVVVRRADPRACRRAA